MYGNQPYHNSLRSTESLEICAKITNTLFYVNKAVYEKEDRASHNLRAILIGHAEKWKCKSHSDHFNTFG